MNIDPHLTPVVDIHGFPFAASTGFESAYSPVFANPLNAEGSHPQHFVQDGTYFDSNTTRQQESHQRLHRSSQQRRGTAHRTTLPDHQRGDANGTPATPQTGSVSRGSRAAPPARIQQPQQSRRQPQPFSGQLTSSPAPSKRQLQPQARLGHVTPTHSTHSTPTSQGASTQRPYPQSPLETPHQLQPQIASHIVDAAPSNVPDGLSTFTAPSTFALVPDPPNLAEWREKLFNIQEPILMTSEQYHTYFPHVDNVYSHRSTQKYKRKPFVSHYWDCRLKGRPTGTPLPKLRRAKEAQDANQDEIGQNTAEHSDKDDKEPKKRKRKTRERDLCDVKIKITEYFGRDELESLGRLGISENEEGGSGAAGLGVNGNFTFAQDDGASGATSTLSRHGIGNTDMTFGVLEPLKHFPDGHPGAGGQRWYMIQRVNGLPPGKEADEELDLDHKHTIEESDRIKKNSVQRWLLAQEKEKKKATPRSKNTSVDAESNGSPRSTRKTSNSSSPHFHASGRALQTIKAHASPASSQLTFFANSYCPFAQRIWIALEIKGIPYQHVEVLPSAIKDGKCTLPEVLEVCPIGQTPCLRHNNFGIWDTQIMMEYLEDLAIGPSLLPPENPQLRAHSRLWAGHINTKVIPHFYALLMVPSGRAVSTLAPSHTPQHAAVPTSQTTAETETTEATRRNSLVNELQSVITELVNASHATGPFFLGDQISFVDVIFAPWIIRLSRVLSFYRDFPRPEIGTRWYAWVDAIENHDAVKRTVSDERSYHNIYGGVGRDGLDVENANNMSGHAKRFAEATYAQQIVAQQRFGLGSNILDRIRQQASMNKAQQ